MASNKTPPELPANIDRYEVRAYLGGGTFGVVYRAFDPRLGREVALKVLRAEMVTSAQAVERFLREARAAAKLLHPHIVPVYDCGQAGSLYFIASAFIQGNTLAEVIPEGGMETRRAVELAAQLASALGYAHGQGVLHRDVKPQNIMLDEQGSLHLMDFGLAAWVQEGGARLTQHGEMMGTPRYMSPEQAGGENAKVGAASDLYAAGVVLYEMLAGRTPFDGPPAALVYQILQKAAAPPSRHRPGLDPRLDTICLRALAKDPARRYKNGEEMAAALQGVTRLASQPAMTSATLRAQACAAAVAAGPRAEHTAGENDHTLSDYSASATHGLAAPPAATDRPPHGARLPWVLSVLASLAVLAVLSVVVVTSLLGPSTGQPPKDTSLSRSDPPPPTTEPPPEVKVAGKFLGVDRDRLTVLTDDGPKTLTVPPTAQVRIDDKHGKLADVKEASSVTITSKDDVVVAVEVKSPPPSSKMTTAGRATKSEKNRLTIQDDAGKDVAFTVPADARVTIDGKAGAVEDIKPGSAVTVAGAAGVASSVEARSPAPSSAPKVNVLLGKAVGVDTGRLTASVMGKERIFIIPADARVVISGRSGKLDDVKKDDSLAVATLDDTAFAVVAAPGANAAEALIFQILGVCINEGADMYNAAGKYAKRDHDYAGCCRLYQGVLIAVRPLLASRPGLQKAIDDGLDDARKTEAMPKRAFALRDVIDGIRSGIKAVAAPPAPAHAPFDAAEAKRVQQAWADHLDLPVDQEINLGGGVTMKLKLIPPGRFTMGSPKDEDGRFDGEGPQHEVEITQPFYMGVYPVTKGQFAAFVSSGPYKTEAETDGLGGFGFNASTAQD